MFPAPGETEDCSVLAVIQQLQCDCSYQQSLTAITVWQTSVIFRYNAGVIMKDFFFFFNSFWIGKYTSSVFTFCNFRGKARSVLANIIRPVAEIPNVFPLLIKPGYIITLQEKKKQIKKIPHSGCSDFDLFDSFIFYAHILHNTSHQVMALLACSLKLYLAH